MQKYRLQIIGLVFLTVLSLAMFSCKDSSSDSKDQEARLADLEKKFYSHLEEQELLNKQFKEHLLSGGKQTEVNGAVAENISRSPVGPSTSAVAHGIEAIQDTFGNKSAEKGLDADISQKSQSDKDQRLASSNSSSAGETTAGSIISSLPVQNSDSVNTGKPAKAKKKGEEKASYTAALNLLEKGKNQEGRAAMQSFISDYPDSSLVPNALYWTGESYYAIKKYEDAIISFKDVVAKYSKSNKAPDALLKIGMCYQQLSDADNAKFYLQTLVQEYPNTRSAALAKKKLSSLK